jgi:hypothetical protein
VQNDWMRNPQTALVTVGTEHILSQLQNQVGECTVMISSSLIYVRHVAYVNGINPMQLTSRVSFAKVPNMPKLVCYVDIHQLISQH